MLLRSRPLRQAPPAPAPTAAERARAVLARTTTFQLTWLDAGPGDPSRSGTETGPVRIAPPRGHLADEVRPVLLEVADPAPVAVRDRIRARLRLTGHAARDGDGLAVWPTIMVLVEGGRTTTVAVDDVGRAPVDPMARMEGLFLSHLAASHGSTVEALARRIPRRWRDASARPRPLALDRYGIVLRLEGPDRQADHRIPFATPVSTPEDLRARLEQLMVPAVPGPRSRR